MAWLRRKFAWRDAGKGSMEQRIQKLADLYIEVGMEVAEIKALLYHGKTPKITPDQLAVLTIEERVNLLLASQQHLAREVIDLKALLSCQAGHSD